jgi:hypothetical protein
VTAADLVVTIGGTFMESYVIEALAREPALVARMAERGARIFVFEPAHDEALEVDARLDHAIASIDTGGTQLPIYIAVIGLYRLSGRYGNDRRPLRVQPTRGAFLGVIGLGEGGAIFLDAEMQAGTAAGLARLRVLVG